MAVKSYDAALKLQVGVITVSTAHVHAALRVMLCVLSRMCVQPDNADALAEVSTARMHALQQARAAPGQRAQVHAPADSNGG